MRFPRHQSTFVIASVLTVASFLGAAAYSQSRLTALDALSSTIAGNGIPSIELLGHAAVRLQRLRRLVHEETTNGHARSTLDSAEGELAALDEEIATYLRLRPLEGERDLQATLQRDLAAATAVVHSTLQAMDQRNAAADPLESEAEPALDRATKTLLAVMEFDARASERLADDVRAVRRGTTRNIILLDGVATVIAALTALIAFRAARDHERLLQRHNDLLTERVADLDRFAGRAAHDILSPLHTVGLGIALAAESADASARSHLDRSHRALQRVRELVEGLLQFARSGAERESGVRSRVDDVLRTAADDSSEAARAARVTLVVDAAEGLEAACSVGVLTSVVQNLVANAIKYMGAQPVRTVTVRARSAARGVRLEVEDTGPGIPAELHEQIFLPFVRGTRDRHLAGLGLGLATVKRLVEGHGGHVGMRSGPGGSLFWIELPAPTPAERSSA